MISAWKARIAALVAAVMVAAATVSVLAQEDGLRTLLEELIGGTAQEEAAAPVRRVPFGRAEMQLSFAPLVRETAPAVVNVYASQEVRMRSPFAGDPFFERFFGRQEIPPRVQSSLGSGVIVDSTGIVVTNHHVVADADEVKVALPDGREFESDTLLSDESLDLAVLRIEADETFPVIAIGNSDALEIGDLVLAIGNPFGVGQTTTSGIVSALARSHVGISDFGFFIQTDAAINPGNSGGALINMAGEVIGINTAIFSQTGGSIGIGFAIPSNMVAAVVAAAKEGRDYFERPYIGADFESVTPDVAEALGMVRPYGALVRDVVADGPAEKAGLRAGDVVVAFNGAAIEHPDALGYRLATTPVDREVEISVLRRGREERLRATVVAPPAGGARLSLEGNGPFAGATVADLSPALAQRLGLPANKKGVAIVEVARGSPARSLGLRPGDILREVNGAEIGDAETMRLVALQDSRWWRFTVERDGQLLQQMLRF